MQPRHLYNKFNCTLHCSVALFYSKLVLWRYNLKKETASQLLSNLFQCTVIVSHSLCAINGRVKIPLVKCFLKGFRPCFQFLLHLFTNKVHLINQKKLCTNKNVLLQEVVQSKGQGLIFIGALQGVLYKEWKELLSIIISVHLKDHSDIVKWKWGSLQGFRDLVEFETAS